MEVNHRNCIPHSLKQISEIVSKKNERIQNMCTNSALKKLFYLLTLLLNKSGNEMCHNRIRNIC